MGIAISGKFRTVFFSGVALAVVFGIPAVLVRTSMEDVPERSRTKVIVTYQDAVDTVRSNFEKHRDPGRRGRLMPLPKNSVEWVELINPLGRKAPSGGLAILPEANDQTGAIGVNGDNKFVIVTLPAYRDLRREETAISAGTVAASESQDKN